ncbi:hypothetical protein ABT282_08695 [Streptomyces sp. NPDC000927]|uniref:hypothetical protein n=1 Tax=Streptomyces sp. NPDC000927 TaxID=3154371 RepID=UPI003333460D
MTEVIHPHHQPGPVTLKVNTPGLPLRIVVTTSITHASVHAVGTSGNAIEVRDSNGTLTVNSGTPGLLSRLFRGSSNTVRASRGGIAAGGSIQNCTVRNSSVVQTGGQSRGPGVYVNLPPRSRVVVTAAARVEISDRSLLAGVEE